MFGYKQLMTIVAAGVFMVAGASAARAQSDGQGSTTVDCDLRVEVCNPTASERVQSLRASYQRAADGSTRVETDRYAIIESKAAGETYYVDKAANTYSKVLWGGAGRVADTGTRMDPATYCTPLGWKTIAGKQCFGWHYTGPKDAKGGVEWSRTLYLAVPDNIVVWSYYADQDGNSILVERTNFNAGRSIGAQAFQAPVGSVLIGGGVGGLGGGTTASCAMQLLGGTAIDLNQGNNYTATSGAVITNQCSPFVSSSFSGTGGNVQLIVVTASHTVDEPYRQEWVVSSYNPYASNQQPTPGNLFTVLPPSGVPASGYVPDAGVIRYKMRDPRTGAIVTEVVQITKH